MATKDSNWICQFNNDAHTPPPPEHTATDYFTLSMQLLLQLALEAFFNV